MLILGLVGGIASGKSVVANYLRDMGAVVLDADRAGHFVLREPEVIAAPPQAVGRRHSRSIGPGQPPGRRQNRICRRQ